MKAIIGRIMTHAKLLLMVASIAVIGLSLEHLTYAASGSLTFSPSSGSYTVGNNFTVTVQENSGTDPANTVDAVVNFPASLQFVSDTTVAPFSFNPATDTASGNSVHITRAQLGTSSTGAQTVTTITFKVLSAGSAPVSFGAGSDILSATDSSNLLTSSPGATYTLNAPSTPPPAPAPTPAPAPAPTPAGTSSGSSGGSTGSSVSVKSSTGGSSGSAAGGVTVPDNGSVAVNSPATVQPATVQPDGVSKVQYYLNGKLVDTETKSPYKYNIDTTKLKNGTYNLVSKTYYTNGTTKQATQHLIVKNAASHKSYSWIFLLVISLVILIVLGVNLIGPAAGNPLRKLFKHRTPPSLRPPASAGGMGTPGGIIGPTSPNLSNTTMPATVSPLPSTATLPSTPSTIPDTPSSHQRTSMLYQLKPPSTPAPGTIFAPSKNR